MKAHLSNAAYASQAFPHRATSAPLRPFASLARFYFRQATSLSGPMLAAIERNRNAVTSNFPCIAGEVRS